MLREIKLEETNRLARKYLSEAKKSLGKKEQFYNALERALHNYLKSKLHIETSEFNKEKINELLTKRSVGARKFRRVCFCFNCL